MQSRHITEPGGQAGWSYVG